MLCFEFYLNHSMVSSPRGVSDSYNHPERGGQGSLVEPVAYLNDSYRDTLKLFLAHTASSCRRPITRLALPDLSSDRVLEFLGMIESVRGNQVRTRNQRLAALRTFYRYLAVHHPEIARRRREGGSDSHKANAASGNPLPGA